MSRWGAMPFGIGLISIEGIAFGRASCIPQRRVHQHAAASTVKTVKTGSANPKPVLATRARGLTGAVQELAAGEPNFPAMRTRCHNRVRVGIIASHYIVEVVRQFCREGVRKGSSRRAGVGSTSHQLVLSTYVDLANDRHDADVRGLPSGYKLRALITGSIRCRRKFLDIDNISARILMTKLHMKAQYDRIQVTRQSVVQYHCKLRHFVPLFTISRQA